MYWDATNKACKQCFLSMCGELGESRKRRGEGGREGGREEEKEGERGGRERSQPLKRAKIVERGEGRRQAASCTYRAMFISTGSKVSARTRSTVPFWVIHDCS